MATLAVIPLALGLLGVFAALVGIGLIWQGWRGRRVGTAPTCRRCNYDLSGRNEADRGESDATSTCPECGVDLGRRRAVAAGGVRRSGRRALLGVMAVLIGLAITTMTLGPRLAGANPLAYVPTGVLLAGERIANDAWRFEIADRIADDRVAERSVTALVDRVLDRLFALHEDDRRGGTPVGSTLRSGVALGELRILEQAFTTDAMSDAQIGRFAEALLAGVLSVAIEPYATGPIRAAEDQTPEGAISSIESGAVAMVAISKAAPPNSGGPFRSVGPHLRIIVRIDELIGPTMETPMSVSWGSTIGIFGSSRFGRSWTVTLPNGRHELSAVGSVSVHRLEEPPRGRVRVGELSLTDPVETGEPTARWPIRLPLVVEVVAATPTIVTPIDDPAFRDAVRAAIRIERGPGAVVRHLGGAAPRGVDDVLVLSVDPSCPVPVCMQVHARVGGRESFLGLLCPATRGEMPLIIPGMEMRFAASGGEGTFDLILRPAEAMLRNRHGMTSYWNEEIVFPGIPIRVPHEPVE